MEQQASFHFNTLPSEIRLMIWTAHLPDVDPPSVLMLTWRWFMPTDLVSRYFLRSLPPEITVDGDDLTARRLVQVSTPPNLDERLRVCKESRHAVLNWVKTRGYQSVPMSPLNEESREAYTKWARTQGLYELEYGSPDDGQVRPGRRVLVRDWDPSRDTLYMTHLTWISELMQEFTMRDETWEQPEARASGWARVTLSDIFDKVRHLASPIDDDQGRINYKEYGNGLLRLCRAMPKLESLYALRVPAQAVPDRDARITTRYHIPICYYLDIGIIQPRWDIEFEQGEDDAETRVAEQAFREHLLQCPPPRGISMSVEDMADRTRGVANVKLAVRSMDRTPRCPPSDCAWTARSGRHICITGSDH